MKPSDVRKMYDRANDLAPMVNKLLGPLAGDVRYLIHTSGFEFRTPTADDNVGADETYVFVAHFAIEHHPSGVASTDVKIGLAFPVGMVYPHAVRRFLATERAPEENP